MGEHCKDCRFFKRGYRLQGLRVPDFCDRHFMSQRSDEPACRDFEEQEKADG